jgi:hypothetical protein
LAATAHSSPRLSVTSRKDFKNSEKKLNVVNVTVYPEVIENY